MALTLEAEREWWQRREQLVATLQSAGTVTVSLDGHEIVASVSRPSSSRLTGDLGIVLGCALLFTFGCVLIAQRHPSMPGLMLALFLMPGALVLLAAGVFELAQITLPYEIHHTLFVLTALGNVGLAAGIHFAFVFPRPHRRWQAAAHRLWILHVVVITHIALIALGVVAHSTLVPVTVLLAAAMTALLVKRSREEQDSTLQLHIFLLACPLPIACVLLFAFFAFAPDLGFAHIDGSSLSLIYLVALVFYAAVFENATLQQRRLAEQLTLREELHDDLLSRLANISLMSEIALQSASDRDSLASKLVSIQGEARANASYARGLLRVSGDERWKDFCVQMRETGIALTSDHAVEFRLVCASDDEDRTLPTPLRICLYKMLREATHNTLKHARASTIMVELALHGDTIDFRYRDDGTGFDERNERPGHYGLGTLRRHAQELGAALHIESSAELGTTLAFSAPVS